MTHFIFIHVFKKSNDSSLDYFKVHIFKVRVNLSITNFVMIKYFGYLCQH